ncbi:hypothetical protein [Helicobacter sp. T3_23-1059]
MYSVKLDTKAIDALSKAVNGNGGHQNLMEKLKRQYDSGNGVLEYDDDDLEKLRIYSSKYGGGGFQDRFQAILACIDK